MPNASSYFAESERKGVGAHGVSINCSVESPRSRVCASVAGGQVFMVSCLISLFTWLHGEREGKRERERGREGGRDREWVVCQSNHRQAIGRTAFPRRNVVVQVTVVREELHVTTSSCTSSSSTPTLFSSITLCKRKLGFSSLAR